MPLQEPLLPQETEVVELSIKLTRTELERDRYKRDIENKERQLKEYEEEIITLRIESKSSCTSSECCCIQPKCYMHRPM